MTDNNSFLEKFKSYFSRAFPFAPENDSENKDYITDNDILIAQAQANTIFNPRLFGKGEGEIKEIAFSYLVAHFICKDIKMAEGGLNASPQFPNTSKSVGSVSASYDIPAVYNRSPILNYLSSTEYGLKYLAIVYPRTIGAVSVVAGTTL